jgi:hypothetical protein
MAISSFIVTTLQLGLDTLAKDPRVFLGSEAIPIMESFVAATDLLVESADEVAATYGDPTMREGIFGYSRQLRRQSEILQVRHLVAVVPPFMSCHLPPWS